MKIITNDTVYVQLKDIYFLNYSLGILPDNLAKKYFSKRADHKYSGYSEYDFVKVSRNHEKEYWKDNIIVTNYDCYKDKSLEDLITYGESISNKLEGMANHFSNPIGREFEIKVVFDGFIDEYKYYTYLLSDIECMVASRRGELDLELQTNKSKQRRKVSK